MVATRINGARLQHGFSLLELLVVLVIAGLLTSLVPSVLSAAVPGARLKSAATEFAQAIDTSRRQAIHSGRIIDFVIDGDPLQYGSGAERVSFPAGSMVTARTSFDMVANPQNSRGMPAEKFLIRFYPDGSSTGATVTLSRNDTAYAVTVDWLLGDVQVTRLRDDALVPR